MPKSINDDPDVWVNVSPTTPTSAATADFVSATGSAHRRAFGVTERVELGFRTAGTQIYLAVYGHGAAHSGGDGESTQAGIFYTANVCYSTEYADAACWGRRRQRRRDSS